MSRKFIQPDEKVPLKLTATERKMVLDDLLCLDQENEQAIRETPSGKPVMMTLDELQNVQSSTLYSGDVVGGRRLDGLAHRTDLGG